MGVLPCSQVMCQWSWDLIFKAELMLESRHRKKKQYGYQEAILKVSSMKMNRPLPLATSNMHMQFEIEIPKQTWVCGNHVVYRRTYGQGETSIPPPPPPHPSPTPPIPHPTSTLTHTHTHTHTHPTSLGGGINKTLIGLQYGSSQRYKRKRHPY